MKQAEIILTNSDKSYALHHGLSDSDMKWFIKDMNEEALRLEIQRDSSVRMNEHLRTPQGSVYDAW